MTDSDYRNTRWICWRCSDIDYLNDGGLCRACAPERVVEWWILAARAGHGESVEARRRWQIG